MDSFKDEIQEFPDDRCVSCPDLLLEILENVIILSWLVRGVYEPKHHPEDRHDHEV